MEHQPCCPRGFSSHALPATVPAARVENMKKRPDNTFKLGHKPNPFIVRESTKAIFIWSAFILLGALLAFTVSKRVTYRKLMVNHIMEPTPMGNPVAPAIAPAQLTTEKPFQLADYRGQWVFVNFWATWCAPCRDEMPSMEMLNRRLNNKMKMVAVTVDQDWNEVNRFFGMSRQPLMSYGTKTKRFLSNIGFLNFQNLFCFTPMARWRRNSSVQEIGTPRRQ